MSVLALSAQVSAQSCDEDPFKTVRETLSRGREPDPDLTSCSPMPGDPRTGVALFAFERPGPIEGVRTYDVDLVLVNVRSGKLKARLSLEGVWRSDAYKIDSAEISSLRYVVRPGLTVFGLKESWSGSSRVSFYTISKLSLFAQRGATIVPLLQDLVTDIYQGEGCDVQTTREIEIQPLRAKGYAPIRVTERLVVLARDETLTCPPGDAETRSEVLTFRNGRYVVPPHLRPFGGAE
jgi:hypothetical protein